MALTDENGMVMPVAPMYGGNGNGFGNGFGGDGWWILLLFLLAGNGGWGFGGGFGGMGGFAADGAMLYPWMNQAEITTNGFQNAQLGNQLTSIQSDLGDIQTQLCSGFAGIEQGANARQIANMQQAFNSQTAITGAITNLASQQADCCCENRLATCQTQNIVQNEGNATRFADANNTRDIIDATNRGNQMILDKLCQLELDGVKQNYENRIAGMQNVIDGLSAQINAADRRVAIGEEVDALYNRLNSCPVPTTPVYGRTPIFTCNNNGCGCGNF